ncbi:MAG: hypothetical protein H0V79_08665 [Actinobacteria bacterium]|nr:hypothetical protein [Actinomycetota bacterium]
MASTPATAALIRSFALRKVASFRAILSSINRLSDISHIAYPPEPA